MRRCEPGRRNSSRAGSRQRTEFRIAQVEARSQETGVSIKKAKGIEHSGWSTWFNNNGRRTTDNGPFTCFLDWLWSSMPEGMTKG